ncbi:antitoxin [Nocardia mangyaensis]|uniref:antitoxin n=1 Tax=Nocardia mangyaensis TaxID=2213200 RepID=UPI0026772EEB|nr:antitoxin [Nocardia mangyaensis]MDO3647153.1 antitoxin [Nocardia mangyaensis]
MRTTLAIDDDVLLAVKERARRENRTAGQVLSELARKALSCSASPSRRDGSAAFHGFEPLPRRGGTISNALIDQLREEEDV